MIRVRSFLVSCLVVAAMPYQMAPAMAQVPRPNHLSTSHDDEPSVLVVISDNRPVGVVRVEVPMRHPVLGQESQPVSVRSEANIIAYPVSSRIQVGVRRRPSDRRPPVIGGGRLLNRVGNLIREIAGGPQMDRQTVARTVTFLMPVADSPPQASRIDVLDGANVIARFDIDPIDRQSTSLIRYSADENDYARSINQWWHDYTQEAQTHIEQSASRPWVSTYLVAMLSRRLELPLPSWMESLAGGSDVSSSEPINPLLETFEWLAGGRDQSQQVFARSAVGRTGLQRQSLTANVVASNALPEPIQWHSGILPGPQNDSSSDTPALIPVEPIAESIPPECFYLRYGSFLNFLWFQDLAAEFGGDLSRMITLNSIATDGPQRLERQLGIKTTAMARLLGPTLIEDQALIGRDLFLDGGSSMGVVMRSTNGILLRASLMRDRQSIADNDAAVSLREVKLEHGTASLLRSSDNQIRSYLVQHGSTFCITNSRTIADRFLEINQSGKSLAQTAGFRHARQTLPLERDDTIFLYLSPEMMQGLLAPQYLIELRRRKHAEADLAVVQIARLAAVAEAPNADVKRDRDLRSISELVDRGFLPMDINDRPDGSGIVEVGEDLVDTRRGARSTFLPITDQPIDRVTADEAAWYQRIADGYNQQFARLDPIFIGIQREVVAESVDDGPPAPTEKRERLSFRAEISPWQPEQYGWLAEQLGPATPIAIQFAPDDIVALQAHVASDALGPPTHLFAAIKDSTPPAPGELNTLIGGYRSLQQLPAYLGAWPLPGVLDRLPLGLGRGQPVAPGTTRLLGGIYRFTGGGFSILSMQPDVLNATLPDLAAMDSDSNAQIRGHIRNLVGSRLEGWVNQQLYERDAAASQANATFLNDLNRRLGCAGDDAIQAAEKILGGRLQCPLRGTYLFDPEKRVWVSSSWRPRRTDATSPTNQVFLPVPEEPPTKMPNGYMAPMLTWFRGLEAEITQMDDRLTATGVVEVARQ
ncbi:MAG: hypothetical protein AAF670_06010 [Planctomycetota bacterium]